MPDDETVEDEQFTHDVAEAATGRRWRVCLWMIAPVSYTHLTLPTICSV